ncbi:5-(carboxyamino)imidazole ribonucleotide synthase [Staphylococcus lutrae]|uniref:N5-carboxyaminoimidazole ribonucleotide synthase n=1 Tax=Staphylococcus lutrae TaxID=155085 RepID=A0AAC9RVA3_9STAP|nr:5-(carboxyamino)imidazole ribonucleotide synthase [Staphylococcus lutrae]ARJ51507.1 5-(carboxyamino)imidazole ribonucleotide synthase [Staphylococcus lutrae]PNZ39256.1 5-(carboxyamino)imidazole ribonucleotide synthase [Staphylococcus lutrae]
MTFNKLKIGQTIGIIGGGQLGKMMAQSAQKMGFRVVVLDPDETCPSRYIAHVFIHAAYDDMAALEKLGQLSDVITYEFENIASEQLKELAKTYHVPQGYQAVQLLQDRYTEKQTLAQAGTKVVPFVKVTTEADLDQAIQTLGYPLMLKTRFGGYDGKGQIRLTSEAQLEEARQLIAQQECVAEQFVNLKMEVSLTVTVGKEGQKVYFPLQENEHRDQILFKTVVPARSDLAQAAVAEVEKITQVVHFVGTFTVEFFITEAHELFVNEIAPRPHNSGHYSIEACDYSQFDTHILAVTGQRLPERIELFKPAIMMNLLGKDLDLLETELFEHPDWHVHLYGKITRKPERKMGHLTLLTDHVSETEQKIVAKFEGRDKSK